MKCRCPKCGEIFELDFTPNDENIIYCHKCEHAAMAKEFAPQFQESAIDNLENHTRTIYDYLTKKLLNNAFATGKMLITSEDVDNLIKIETQ